MKKKHGLDRAVPIVPRSELETWRTGALLARLKRLRWCEEGPERSDLSPEEIASVSQMILFKNDPAWRLAYSDIKAALSRRPHVRGKP